MKITKEEFEKLYSDDITKKEYDRIISAIDVRFVEIMKVINKTKPSSCWFDYDNLDYQGEESGGYFDPEYYKEDIGFGGECLNIPEPYYDSFPTRWLWEDFEDEFKREVETFQKQEKLKKEKEELKKAEKQNLIKQIKSKLTKEEWAIIKFK